MSDTTRCARAPTRTRADLPDLIVDRSDSAVFDGRRLRCAVGRAGRGYKRREGDGVTPQGRHRIRLVLHRADRVAAPKAPAPVASIRVGDGWCDAPGHPAYNRLIRRPFAGSHETLWRADGLYDIVCALDWRAAEPGGGSAIFLHCAAPDYRATAGCVALAVGDLRNVLAEMSRGDAVQIL